MEFKLICRKELMVDQISDLDPIGIQFNQLTNGKAAGSFTYLSINGLQLRHITFPVGVQTYGNVDRETVAIGTSLSNNAYRWNGIRFTPDNHNLYICHPEIGINLIAEQDIKIISVLVSHRELNFDSNIMFHKDIEKVLRNEIAIPVSSGARQAIEYRILTHLDSEIAKPGLLNMYQLRQSIKKRFRALLLSVIHDNGKPCLKVFPGYRNKLTREAIDYMMANLTESVEIQDLCRLTKVSARSLLYAFKEVVGISPMRYFKRLRLNQARYNLQAGRQVIDTAYAFGFWHLGQFARDYKAFFGELPSETYRKARHRLYRTTQSHLLD